MAGIVGHAFDDAFKKCTLQPSSRTVLMDNCTRQNSAAAMLAMTKNNTRVFNIPPRSPDLNPIENFFNLIKKLLRKEAMEKNIMHETFEEFSQRCIRSMTEYPASEVDKIINSMPKRINAVLKFKGRRLKY